MCCLDMALTPHPKVPLGFGCWCDWPWVGYLKIKIGMVGG